MKRPSRYYLTYIWTLPYDLVAWFFILLLWIFWGTKLHWLEGVWFEWKEESWPVRTWYKKWGGTTLGHGGFLSPGHSGKRLTIDTKVEFHEHVHTEQFEVSMLIGFIISVIVALVLLITGSTFNWHLILSLWNFSWPITVFCSMLQAWLRGENSYAGSALEEAAYALAENYERKKAGDAPWGNIK